MLTEDCPQLSKTRMPKAWLKRWQNDCLRWKRWSWRSSRLELGPNPENLVASPQQRSVRAAFRQPLQLSSIQRVKGSKKYFQHKTSSTCSLRSTWRKHQEEPSASSLRLSLASIATTIRQIRTRWQWLNWLEIGLEARPIVCQSASLIKLRCHNLVGRRQSHQTLSEESVCIVVGRMLQDWRRWTPWTCWSRQLVATRGQPMPTCLVSCLRTKKITRSHRVSRSKTSAYRNISDETLHYWWVNISLPSSTRLASPELQAAGTWQMKHSTRWSASNSTKYFDS